MRTPIIILSLFLALSAWAKDNISGRIVCNSKGVSGVIVSDGYLFTQTDADGYYSLQSEKRNGYIFYEIPSGYIPAPNGLTATEKNYGGFWKSLYYPKNVNQPETVNFMLQEEPNDEHIMVFTADPQVGNNNYSDLAQYKQYALPRMKEEKQAAGLTPIYNAAMGDLAYNYYWYSTGYDLPAFQLTNVSASYPFRQFCVMGNHDHDGGIVPCDETDFLSSGAYRRVMGPNYYSYNIGQIHYVVLDDIVFKNEQSGWIPSGCVGSCNYDCYVTDEQLAWLEKDLSYVDKNTPVFIQLHAPLWKFKTDFTAASYLKNSSTERIAAMLMRFTQVHVISGHTHKIQNFTPYKNIFEHNLCAMGGNLWFAGWASGTLMCQDGTPAGYEVFHFKGKEITWQYHTLVEKGNPQFRVIDINTVRPFYESNSTLRTIISKYSQQDLATAYPANSVLINVFNYDPKWTVEVWEGDTKLPVERVWAQDVTMIMAYDIPFYQKTGADNTYDNTVNSSHIFLAQASDATTPLRVLVTDRFGNEYSQTVQRPVACDLPSMAQPNTTDLSQRPNVFRLPLDIKILEAINKSNTTGQMPTDFPASNKGTYRSAWQATAVDGKLYANDCNTKTLLPYACANVTGGVDYQLFAHGTDSYGIASDDAGNLIMRNDGNATSPHSLVLFPHANPADSVCVEFSLPHAGETPFISAMGDVFSAEGGYVYFFPKGQQYVEMVKIQNGTTVSVISFGPLSAAGSGYVIPTDRPDRFFYQNNGLWEYRGRNRGATLAGDMASSPALNNTKGGAWFLLDDHEMLVYPSGGNYNGGFSLIDLNSQCREMYSVDKLGKGGLLANKGLGASFKVEYKDEHTVWLYEYCPGSGYALWQLSTTTNELSGMRSVEVVSLPTGPVYDLSGKVLPKAPEHGVYISNGRKYLKK